MSESRDAIASDDRKLIEKLLLSAVQEQRRSRRWKIFFRLLFFIWLFAVLLSISFSMSSSKPKPQEYTALVQVNGVIASGRDASTDAVVTGLRDAFQDKNVRGVIVRINSPGGSPVQAGYIYDEINRLKATREDIKVYAVIADVGASAAYYIAAAADEIYANRASVVGSIGAFMASFGFNGAMEKLGITRRFYGAGEHKALTDPFQPEDPVAAQHLRATVADIHQQFIASVKKGRGGRLGDDPSLFSGLIWTGQQAKDLGLVDGLGSSGYVARELIGAEEIVDYTVKPSVLDRFANQVGTSITRALSVTLGLEGTAIR